MVLWYEADGWGRLPCVCEQAEDSSEGKGEEKGDRSSRSPKR